MDTIHVEKSESGDTYHWRRVSENGRVVSSNAGFNDWDNAIQGALAANPDDEWDWDDATTARLEGNDPAED